MRRHLRGLARSATETDIPDRLYLVRILRAHHRWHKHKPFYDLTFYVLEPKALVAGAIPARLSCAPKSLWRLAWFLRDFRYSQELLEQEEIDTRAMLELRGVIQVAHEGVNGHCEVILKAFAPASDWPHLVPIPNANPEVA